MKIAFAHPSLRAGSCFLLLAIIAVSIAAFIWRNTIEIVTADRRVFSKSIGQSPYAQDK